MIDAYSKIVLTVIALALCVISAQGFMSRASAQMKACGDTAGNSCFVQTGGLGYVLDVKVTNPVKVTQ